MGDLPSMHEDGLSAFTSAEVADNVEANLILFKMPQLCLLEEDAYSSKIGEEACRRNDLCFSIPVSYYSPK